MSTKEFLANGSIKELEQILKELQASSVFLVTGKSSYAKSGAKASIESLLKGLEVHRFFEFSENPKLEDVKTGIAEFRRGKFDLIIAIGGGSVIDTAKLISTLAKQSGNPKDYALGTKKLEQKRGSLILIPTTSGTGSEATRFAVVYVDGTKSSIDNKMLLPDYSIIDPELSYTMPPSITASTGMDALAQAIESYWCINSTEQSKAYAKKAIILAMDNLEQAVKNPNPENRFNMALASNLAGKAIDITRTTAPHAFSYAFTSYHNLPHGHAVGLTLGRVLEFNGLVTEKDVSDKRGAEYIFETIMELCEMLGADSPHAASFKLYKLMQAIGLESDLQTLGISGDEALEKLRNNVNPARLGNNPRKISKADLENIIS